MKKIKSYAILLIGDFFVGHSEKFTTDSNKHFMDVI